MDGNKEISKLVQELKRTPEDLKKSSHIIKSDPQNTFSSISSSFEIIRHHTANNLCIAQEKAKINEEDHCKTLTDDNYSIYDDSQPSNQNNMNIDYLMQMRSLHSRNETGDLLDQRMIPIDQIYMKQENKQETKFNTGRWSAEEHQKFIEAMFLYGNEWKRVQQHIKTRSSTQSRSHAQKFFIRLRKKFLEDSEDTENTKSVSTRRNEKIFNWIKETVNYDTIVKLAKSSGSLLSSDDKLDNSQGNIITNSSKISGQSALAITNPMTPSQESFFTERKDKMCKIILNLITNPSKTKRKSFSKEDFSDYAGCDDEEMDEKENLSKRSVKLGISNTHKPLNPNPIKNIVMNKNFDKEQIPSQRPSTTSCNNMNNFTNNNNQTNSLSTIPVTPMPLPNLEIEDNTYNYNYNCSDYFPFSNNLFENTGNNYSLFNENLDMKNSKMSTSKNCSPYTDTHMSPLINNGNTNPTSNNYYNPNMNSYINIVTINLGCNGNQPNEDSVTNKSNLPISENVNKSNVNTSVNKNNNLKNSEIVNNSNCIVGNQPNNESNIRDMLSRKLLMMEYQKIMKNGNKSLLTGSNVISNGSHLNIINGVAKLNEKESDKDKEGIDNDPFKLTFEENAQMSQISELSPHPEENDVNLNLDLDHFFNADNFLN